MAKPDSFISTLTELVNQSLGMIGLAENDLLTDLETDTSIVAKKSRLFVYTVIRTLIGQLRPEELITRTVLVIPEDITADQQYDWGYRYALPDDYIGTLWTDKECYNVEGGYVYTNVIENFNFGYIKYSIDPSEWSGELLEVMRYRIALALCIPITDNEVKYDSILAESKRIIEPLCERIMSYGKKYPNSSYKQHTMSRLRGRGRARYY